MQKLFSGWKSLAGNSSRRKPPIAREPQKKTPHLLSQAGRRVFNPHYYERNEPMNSTARSKMQIAFEGDWETLNRKLFPDLSDTKEGHLVAVEAVGHGVIIGGTSDPTLYMLTLDKRYRAKGITLGAVVVSARVKGCYAQARALVYELTGLRTIYSGLVGFGLEDVKTALVARLGSAAA